MRRRGVIKKRGGREIPSYYEKVKNYRAGIENRPGSKYKNGELKTEINLILHYTKDYCKCKVGKRIFKTESGRACVENPKTFNWPHLENHPIQVQPLERGRLHDPQGRQVWDDNGARRTQPKPEERYKPSEWKDAIVLQNDPDRRGTYGRTPFYVKYDDPNLGEVDQNLDAMVYRQTIPYNAVKEELIIFYHYFDEHLSDLPKDPEMEKSFVILNDSLSSGDVVKDYVDKLLDNPKWINNIVYLRWVLLNHYTCYDYPLFRSAQLEEFLDEDTLEEIRRQLSCEDTKYDRYDEDEDEQEDTDFTWSKGQDPHKPIIVQWKCTTEGNDDTELKERELKFTDFEIQVYDTTGGGLFKKRRRGEKQLTLSVHSTEIIKLRSGKYKVKTYEEEVDELALKVRAKLKGTNGASLYDVLDPLKGEYGLLSRNNFGIGLQNLGLDLRMGEKKALMEELGSHGERDVSAEQFVKYVRDEDGTNGAYGLKSNNTVSDGIVHPKNTYLIICTDKKIEPILKQQIHNLKAPNRSKFDDWMENAKYEEDAKYEEKAEREAQAAAAEKQKRKREMKEKRKREKREREREMKERHLQEMEEAARMSHSVQSRGNNNRKRDSNGDKGSARALAEAFTQAQARAQA